MVKFKLVVLILLNGLPFIKNINMVQIEIKKINKHQIASCSPLYSTNHKMNRDSSDSTVSLNRFTIAMEKTELNVYTSE